MTTKISQWQRIALLAAGISASVAPMAWSQNLYQTHLDGSIWQYTGTPCSRGTCPGWVELDNNPDLSMIAAESNELFELHKDGSIWQYTGSPCSGGFCPGWVELDNNPTAVSIGVGGNILYEVHSDGSLWWYTGTPCSGGFCPGWAELLGSQIGSPIPFGANAALLVSEHDGAIYQWVGAENWPLIGDTFGTTSLAVGTNSLYTLQKGGGIWQYTGSPSPNDWVKIQDLKASLAISAGGALYQQQRRGNTIWQYTVSFRQRCVNSTSLAC